MGFFNGKKERLDLSDEALLAAAQMAAAGENADPRGMESDGGDRGKEGDGARWQRLQAQYEDMQGRLPDIYRCLLQERQARQALEQTVRQLLAERGQGASGTAEEKPVREDRGGQESRQKGGVSRKVQESLEPLLQAMRQNQERSSFDRALRLVQAMFPQTADAAEAKRLMQGMIERSRQWGDGDIWRKHPEEMMKLAALDLYGAPQTQGGDGSAAAADLPAEPEALFAGADKAGLAIYPKNNKGSQSDPSEEEKIIKGIFSAGKGRFFD
ncbi:MAG: hypothetical protein K6B40_05350 [Firmicutes bacterium]|nr:hypothetical protein [Bacillota bacterium]